MQMPTSEEYDAAKAAFEKLYEQKKVFDQHLQECEAKGLAITVEQVSNEVRGGQTINTTLKLTWQFSDTVR